jgi:hypothetical protein
MFKKILSFDPHYGSTQEVVVNLGLLDSSLLEAFKANRYSLTLQQPGNWHFTIFQLVASIIDTERYKKGHELKKLTPQEIIYKAGSLYFQWIRKVQEGIDEVTIWGEDEELREHAITMGWKEVEED